MEEMVHYFFQIVTDRHLGIVACPYYSCQTQAT